MSFPYRGSSLGWCKLCADSAEAATHLLDKPRVGLSSEMTCWREGFESLTALPGQSAMLQNLVCFSGPSQGFPPNCGGLHVRVRSLYPLPHVEEHKLHGDHSSQVPCTAIEAEVSSLSKGVMKKWVSPQSPASAHPEWAAYEKWVWQDQEQTNPKTIKRNIKFSYTLVNTKCLLLSRLPKTNHNALLTDPSFSDFQAKIKGHFLSKRCN